MRSRVRSRWFGHHSPADTVMSDAVIIILWRLPGFYVPIDTCASSWKPGPYLLTRGSGDKAKLKLA